MLEYRYIERGPIVNVSKRSCRIYFLQRPNFADGHALYVNCLRNFVLLFTAKLIVIVFKKSRRSFFFLPEF